VGRPEPTCARRRLADRDIGHLWGGPTKSALALVTMSATIPGGKNADYSVGKMSDEAVAASRAKKTYTQTVTNPYAEGAGERVETSGGTGKRSFARNEARQLSKEVDRPNPFKVPDHVQMAFKRNTDFIKRTFSPDTFFSQLPPAVGQSLSRNFSFFTRIFTQFFDPKGTAEVRESIPGLASQKRKPPGQE